MAEIFVALAAAGDGTGSSWANAKSLANAIATSPGADSKFYIRALDANGDRITYPSFVPNFAGSAGHLHEWYFNGSPNAPNGKYYGAGYGAFVTGLTQQVIAGAAWARVKGHYNVYRTAMVSTIYSLFIESIKYANGLPIHLWNSTAIPYENQWYTYYQDTINGILYVCLPPDYPLLANGLTLRYYTVSADACTIGTGKGYHKIIGAVFYGGGTPVTMWTYAEIYQSILYGGYSTSALFVGDDSCAGASINYSLLLNYGRATTYGLIRQTKIPAPSVFQVNNCVMFGDGIGVSLTDGKGIAVQNTAFIDVATPYAFAGVSCALTESNNFYGVKYGKTIPITDTRQKMTLTNAQVSRLPVDKIVVYNGSTYTEVANGSVNFPVGVGNRVYIRTPDRAFTAIKMTPTVPGSGYTVNWKYPGGQDWSLPTNVGNLTDNTASGTVAGNVIYSEPSNPGWQYSWVNSNVAWGGYWICAEIATSAGAVGAQGVTFSIECSIADPKVKDFENLDFSLNSGSPCVNNGLAIDGLAADFAGKALAGLPDIGAFEYIRNMSHSKFAMNIELEV